MLEPVDAGDLLDHVDLARDVDEARRRHAHVDRALPGARIEAEAIQDLDRPCQRHLERGDVRDALHAHPQLQARRQVGADVDRARRHVGAAQLHEQPGGRTRGERREVGVDALLPAVRGLGAQAELLRGAHDLGAREVGRLEHDRRRVVAHLGVGGAHDAGDALRRLRVCDHEHRREELALLPVQRAQHLARPSAPRRQARAAQMRVIVGVERAAEVVHDVVRDVDDVRDRAHPRGVQAGLEPERRRADLDVLEDARREAGAEILVLDRDRDPVGRQPVAECGRLAVVERRQIDAEDRVHVARHAPHREQVGAIRGDLELQHVVRQRHARCERLAGLPAVAEHDDPFALGRDVELALRQDHAVGGLAAQLRARDARGRPAAPCPAAPRRRCRRPRSSRLRTRLAAARPPPRRPGRTAGGRRSGACRPRARARRRSAPRRRPRPAGPRRSTPSTLSPASESRAVSSSRGGSSARWSASHCSGTFIARPPGTARGSARRCRRSS